MDIKLSNEVLKKLAAAHENEALADALEHSWGRDKEIEVDILTAEEIATLVKLCEEDSANQVSKTAATKLKSFAALAESPEGKKIGRLEMLCEAMKLFLAKVPKHWVFESANDGMLLPRYVTGIEFSPAEKYSPAHVTMKLEYIERGHKKSRNHHWHQHDIKGGTTVLDLFKKDGIIPATPELLALYEEVMKRYDELQPQTGAQFTGEGEAKVLASRWHQPNISLVRDGIPASLIMDDANDEAGTDQDGDDITTGAFGKDSGMVPDSFWQKKADEAGQVALPIWPIVKMFDLEQHAFIFVSTDLLKEYVWNPKLGDKLVLPEDHKEVITVLMHTAQTEIEDIIAGKSGGTIVICTGEPGTGKTLTAEVTSEVVQRPLYKVNCSQLGTDEEEIEAELTRVLARATRWKALLLIDEADVYVRSRGTDIQQNAIVGIFLRILEYYRGILFLTSNMGTEIDDAIMSRATVHLKYLKPTPEALHKIWQVLNGTFKAGMGEALILDLCKKFPGIAGRDVKNLLKLVMRHSKATKKAIDLKLFLLLAIHKDITPAN